MAKQKILQPGVNYSFRSYFELPNDTDEILAEFGYSFRRARLSTRDISSYTLPDDLEVPLQILLGILRSQD